MDLRTEDGVDRDGPLCRVYFGNDLIAILNKVGERWLLSWVVSDKPFEDKQDAINHVRLKLSREPI